MFPGLWRKQDCDQVECAWDLVSNSGQRKLTNSSRNYCTFALCFKKRGETWDLFIFTAEMEKEKRARRSDWPSGRQDAENAW